MKLKNQKLKSHNEQLRWWGCSSCCEVLFKLIFNCVGQFTIVQLKWKSSSQVGILNRTEKADPGPPEDLQIIDYGSDYILLGWKAPQTNKWEWWNSIIKKGHWSFSFFATNQYFPSNLQICRQCRRGVSIQCLESPTPSTIKTTTTSTTSSSAAPGGVEVDPVVPKDKVVSRWDDQMEVAN